MLKFCLSRPVLRAAITAALVMLAGCSLKEINRMDRQASGDADTAQRITQSRTNLQQAPVTWTDKPWVNLQPVIPVVSTPEDSAFPDCDISINRPEGMTLPEIGQRITAMCGLRVTITPDALQALVSTGGGSITTQQLTGKLPAPDDNGRVPLPNIGGQAQQVASVSLTDTVLTGLKWQGKLRGFLDMVSSRLGLSARNDHGTIVFYQLDTRTYQLVILNTKIDSTASVNSGSGNQLGSSGGGSSGTSGDINSAQKTAYDLSSNLYDDIRKTIDNMITPSKGRYWLSSASGTLTVTDTPVVLDRIGRYIDYQNKVLNRQVQLSVRVLSVTQTRNEQMGLDWGLVYKSLHTAGATLSGNFTNAADNAVSSGFSILDTASGSAARFSGSQLLIKALSEQGNVSVVTQLNRATTNLTPVPYQLSNQKGILTSSSSTATANVGVTSSMQTSILTTGLFMTMLPYIQESGDVQLQFAFSYSSPPKIESFVSKDGNTRNDVPTFQQEALTQKVNMRAGETLVLTGSDQVTTSADKQGTFTPGNFMFGGGQNGSTTRTTLVILVTPVLLR
ncbi:PilN family type IVB pilus formation outer membrane protein [Dickeya dianthicola]|jgi:type IVB pilus formation R64 PilN family outer membrane protein|uniref:PilN family type IVB pilus formation outer membrane protein n=1 Tax=Enterobacterales TaxID=91347 RepID=UPI0007454030|nr:MULTISPECIES: PilN family type IVB pilus formation outer membrane protein [Enterobacterales]MBU9861700.1 PilN family type IVB pilus formation outer membrane protein [Rahnella aceris]MCI4186774.1 PilN family type IVB pilus formation outer membrane protein [Dickeya dianthicola]CVB07188.1 Bundle-forming pilus B [Serratia marcescens]